MKKYFLLTLATGLALSASAAEPITINSGGPTLIPSIVASDSQDFLAFDDDKSITIYNSDIAQIANIALPERQEVTLRSWRQERASQPKDMILTNTVTTNDVLKIDGRDLGITPTQALDHLNHSTSAEAITIDGETVICLTFAGSNYFDKTYPEKYYKLIDGRWTLIICEYQYGEWGNYGEWGEVRHESNTVSYGNYLQTPDLSYNGGIFEEIPVTQTFFNNDNKFEFIVENNEVVEFTIEEDGYRAGGERVETKGFLIKNEDGATLHTITLPTEYRGNGYSDYLNLFIISGKKYIAIEVYDNKVYSTLLYQISELGSIKAPAVIKGSLKVRPAISRRGESVTVEIGAEAQPGCTVSVIGMNGHEVQRVKVAAGNSSTNVNTGALTPGSYIVTVANGNTRREAAKIIVR